MSKWEGEITQGDFAKTTVKRLPICLCLDTSGSMMAPTESGKTRMEELNAALAKFFEAMKSNEDVAASADISMITFGGEVNIIQKFAPLSGLDIPTINVKERSLTPLGTAIQVAIKLLDMRKQGYKEKGMKYYQPWMIVLTDGEPEGKDALQEMEIAVQQTIELESDNKLAVFNIGIGPDAGLEQLKRLSNKRSEPIKVDETNLDELFEFLGASSDMIVSGGDDKVLYDDVPSNLDQGEDIDLDKWCI